MKLLLLRVLLQRRARDEGFTLPMVIALGLVMLLLGTANIVKSSEENLNATIQNSSSDASAIAEVGITKYRELLNQNRILTIYNHDQWTSNSVTVGTNTIDVAGQACIDLTSAPTGWTGTATLINDTAATATDTTTTDNDNWWNVSENIDGVAGDDLIGKYRLVSYIYDNDNNPADNDNGQFSPDDDASNADDSFIFNDGTYNPRGILTVQGESTDGSQAQIQVEIPLRINDLVNFAPVLWIGDNTITAADLNNVTVNNGNVVVKDSPTSSADGCGNFDTLANGASRPVISSSRNIPSIDRIKNIVNDARYDSKEINSFTPTASPTIIEPNPPIRRFGGTALTKFTILEPPLTALDPALGLGEECEKDTDFCFLYNLPLSLNITNVDAKTDGVANTIVYIDSPVNITANALMLPATKNAITIGSDTSSDYFELYVDNGNAIDINVTAGKTININGFIHAPTSTLTISGAGTVNINGSVWVGDFVNNNTTVNITSDRTDTATGSDNSYKFYTTSAMRTPRPLTSSPTNWAKEEVE